MALPVWQDLDKTHQVIIAAALGLALALVALVRLQPSLFRFPLRPEHLDPFTLTEWGRGENRSKARD